MTEVTALADTLSDPADPTMAAFWSATRRGELLLQQCRSCGRFQFYPRPLCLACEGADLIWTASCGRGTIYSSTRCHVQLLPELPPPYFVALVDLEEGPRLLSNVVGANCEIGARVSLTWRDRGSLPPLPIFAVTAADIEVSNGQA